MKKRINKMMTCLMCTTLIITCLGDWNGSQYPTHQASAASTTAVSTTTSFTKKESADSATGVNVRYHTKDEIRTYINNYGAPINAALSFAEDPITVQPYSLGKLSDETLQSALSMVNQIRYIAGISYQVQLSDEYNELTQAASLANYINNTLSHTPEQPSGMSDAMYELARQGAGSSNIAWGSWSNRSLNSTIVSSWMEDGDSYNIDRVGHRRWLLNPTMGKTGFGSVSGQNGTYSAVYAFDRTNSSAEEYGVMWPAQTMPVEYFGTEFPWSISMGYSVDIASVKVTLTKKSDGTTWNFSQSSSDGSFYVNNDGYGQTGCIIFRPDTGIDSYQSGDEYTVEITGLSQGDVSYTVTFFDLVPETSETTAPTVSPASSEPASTEPSSTTPGSTLSPLPPETITPGTETPVSSRNPAATPTATPLTTPTVTPVPTRTPDPVKTPGVTKSPDTGTGSSSTKTPAVGSAIKDAKNIYIVTHTAQAKKTVKYAGPQNKNITSVTIPKKVKINGLTYQVTGIRSNAFKGCKILKHITIQPVSLTLKNVGQNAFRGIHPKAVIKVPAKKYNAYKKLLRKRGAPTSGKIKKKL